MMDIHERLQKESESLRGSIGWRVNNQLREMQFTFALHSANYVQLKSFCTDLVGDTDERVKRILELHDERNRDRIMLVLNETCRLLHNFLASAKMLVDHTRIHARSLYANHPFMSEYDLKVGNLAKEPLCRFVQQLRDYNLHYRFPMVGCSMRIPDPSHDGVPTSKIVLDLRALRHWDRWGPEAIAYMDARKEDPPVAHVAAGYMWHILQFYIWMWNRELEVWRPELSEVEAKIGRIEALNQKAFPDLVSLGVEGEQET